MAITPQTTERSVALRDEHKLTFDLLRDEGNAYAAGLGLRYELPGDLRALYLQFGIDLADSNGEPGWTLPLPARYVIDPAGTVRYARVHHDYTTRPEPAETLQALRD